MKRTPSWLKLLAAAIWLFAGAVQANNLGFLKNTVAALLTDEDRELQRAAMTAVLDDDNPTTQKEWKNSQSGHSGSIRSLGNYRSEDGLHCRKLKIANLADGLKNEATYPACKTPEGEWIVASGKKLTKAP
jgi:surface antigen